VSSQLRRHANVAFNRSQLVNSLPSQCRTLPEPVQPHAILLVTHSFAGRRLYKWVKLDAGLRLVSKNWRQADGAADDVRLASVIVCMNFTWSASASTECSCQNSGRLLSTYRTILSFFLISRFNSFLNERYYVTFTLWHGPSTCLSSNVVAPYLNGWTIRQHFTAFIWTLYWNFDKKIEGILGDRARGMKNWRFSTNIPLYFENGTSYGHSYNGRRIGTHIPSIKWCHL